MVDGGQLRTVLDGAAVYQPKPKHIWCEAHSFANRIEQYECATGSSLSRLITGGGDFTVYLVRKNIVTDMHSLQPFRNE